MAGIGGWARAAWGAALFMAMATAVQAATDDLDNAAVRIEADGTLVVDGVIGPRFEPDISDALAQHPDLRRVVVRSPGGLRAQAMRVGELVNRRGLTVRVEGRCASACALLFATARSREMTADSRIGLHRSSLAADLPIPDSLRRQLIERNDRETDEVLRKGGFPPRVIRMGADTPPSTMIWFTADELRVEGLAFTLVGPGTGVALPAATLAGASLASPR